MVATAEQAESVLYGDGKAAAALKPGSVVLLMATVGPAAVEDWARRLARDRRRRSSTRPCPVVPPGPGRVDLLIMVSGSETALATVQPLLDVMARNAPVVGTEPGDGQKVKLVNQLLCGVHIAVAAEALAYAEALGLDAGETWEVLRHGAAASFMLDDRGARMVDNPNNDIRSTIDIFVKDMGLVTEAARAKAYPTPLASAAETALPRRPPRRPRTRRRLLRHPDPARHRHRIDLTILREGSKKHVRFDRLHVAVPGSTAARLSSSVAAAGWAGPPASRWRSTALIWWSPMSTSDGLKDTSRRDRSAGLQRRIRRSRRHRHRIRRRTGGRTSRYRGSGGHAWDQRAQADTQHH